MDTITGVKVKERMDVFRVGFDNVESIQIRTLECNDSVIDWTVQVHFKSGNNFRSYPSHSVEFFICEPEELVFNVQGEETD